ncbi:hypothetical protein I317_02148 [Kwoniella heveanensis CBS 569]|nr:hypothetical protein I317_02148 [Kwoniella heveanensis CBS 569]
MIGSNVLALALTLLAGTQAVPHPYDSQVGSLHHARSRAHNHIRDVRRSEQLDQQYGYEEEFEALTYQYQKRADGTTTSGWDYVGCVTDGSARALPAVSITRTAMTVDMCKNYCQTQGYTYAGLEEGNTCYCDNSIKNGLGVSASSWTCATPCVGDSGQTCGGHWKMSLYRAGSASGSGDTYQGCFSGAKILSSIGIVTNTITPATCTNYCTLKGYGYAGTTLGNNCWCGNTLDTSKKLASDSTCSTKCSGDSSLTCGGTNLFQVYIAQSSAIVTTSSAPSSTSTSKAATSTSTSTSTTTSAASTAMPSSLGCFSETGSSKLLSAVGIQTNTITPISCARYCTTKGYGYAGVTKGNECWCGNTLDMSRKLSSTADCSTKCSGDATMLCGGTNRVGVYIAKDGAGTLTTVASSATTTTSAAVSTSSSTSAVSTTTSTSSQVGEGSATVGVASVPKATGTKQLYAHHMVGNTYSYTQATWSDDITQAQAAGIDGFALNYGSDSWQPARLSDAYTAAAAKGFKMFLSMDVTSLGCSSTGNAASLVNQIAAFASNSAQAKVGSKVLVSTFAGNDCTFGQSSVDSGWKYFRSLISAQSFDIYLMPALFSDISTFSKNTWMDGEFNWDSGWPMAGDALTTASDQSYMNALSSNQTYMAAVSPAFFTYYSPSTYNKNWIYRGDDWLLARRMEQIISMRAQFDFAEIISWNDYGESHYIGPIRADQPNSQGWTNGMPHTAWLEVIKYYAPAFKTGSYPSASDQLVLWTRPHPKAASASAPSMDRPRGWNYTDDLLYAWVALKAASQVTVTSGSNSVTWNLPAGVSKLSVKSNAGTIGAKIVRSGSTVKSYDSTGAFSYTK